jgi:uncharacterized protein YceK
MKMLSILLVCLLVCAGCSGLTASSAMTKTIDVNAANAASLAVRVQNGNVQPPEATAAILDNAVTFNMYAGNATTNVLAYLFDKNKQLLANAAYYTLIQSDAARATETAKRAAATTQPSTWLNPVLTKECSVMVRYGDAIHGKAGAQ